MKKLTLILLILGALVLLNGCCMNCCPTCPPVTQTCSLEVTAGYWVWGEVYINDQPTGKKIDYSIPGMKTIIINNVPCNQQVSVVIVDPCGYRSHTEWIFINPGLNVLNFAYW